MRFYLLRSAEALEALVEEVGFLPFFAGEIPGFSVEECTPRELWFAEDADGPWEWKGPVAARGRAAYGKFFRGRAGFISLAHFPRFANWRRDGYDFDARFDDGLAMRKDKQIVDALLENGPMLTRTLKRELQYSKTGQKGFETVITRLQMQTYVTVRNFEYMQDRNGTPYGWGMARYATAEQIFGEGFLEAAYREEPEEAGRGIAAYLRALLPDASEKQIERLLRP